MTGPIIVTALFDAAAFAWLDGLRRAHFPPDRNQVPAHLTLFHHLPPGIAAELDRRLLELARGPPPAAAIVGPMMLGQGVALRVRSEGLAACRDELAEAFAGLLVPQDAAGWRAHVTIQNKVPPDAARALHQLLVEREQWPRPLGIAGLASWHYRGGPWEPIRRYRFSRSGRRLRN